MCETRKTSIMKDGAIIMVNPQRQVRGLTVVDANEILGVAARVVDRGRSFFVERPGSLDFFKNTLTIEELDGDNDV
jgi:hypothetical protein